MQIAGVCLIEEEVDNTSTTYGKTKLVAQRSEAAIRVS